MPIRKALDIEGIRQESKPVLVQGQQAEQAQ